MNLQNVLDQTALIAGGTLIREGVYGGAGAISAGGRSVKFAYSLLPEPSSVGEDGLVHVSYIERGEVDPDGEAAGDLTVYRHEIRMDLMLSVLRSDEPNARRLLTPFVPAYLTSFAAKGKLNGAASVARIRGWDIVDAIYPNRMALRFTLEAFEKEGVTYVAA